MDLALNVQQTLREAFPARARVLCAVSGGPDSVVLAHALRAGPFSVVLGHVDHQLRSGSVADARFVRNLAARWDLPFKLARVNVKGFAKKHHTGIEEAARSLRYQALARLARQWRCQAIVTAHTADDQAETVLMNFLRGSGPGGLAGIPPTRRLSTQLQLSRPLLQFTRQDVMSYLKAHHLPFRTDPSNRSMRFMRNRIRHEVLPLLEKRYPGLKKRLGQMAVIFQEERRLWAPQVQREFNKTVRQNNKRITVDLTQLLGYHRALGRRILRHLLTGISFQDTERIYQLALSPNGHLPLQLAGGLRVKRKGNKLIIFSSRGFHE